MKKKLFIGLTLFLLIGTSSFCLLNFSKDFPKKELFWDLKDNVSLTSNESKLKKDNEKVESTETTEDKEQNINEEKEEPTSTTSNNESKKEQSVAKQEALSPETPVIKNNEKKTEQKPVVEEKQPDQAPSTPSTPPKESTPVVEAPKCTPRKFDMSFVRADFDTKAECDSVGMSYVKSDKKYGYICDHYQDDCLTTYYMLTIYERNTGTEYDFHTIPLP